MSVISTDMHLVYTDYTGSEVLIILRDFNMSLSKFTLMLISSQVWTGGASSVFCVCVCIFNTLIEVLLNITKGRCCEQPCTSIFLDTHWHFLLGRYLGVK